MGYISALRVGQNGEIMPVGSMLFGICNETHEQDPSIYLVNLEEFDVIPVGITIHVKFIIANEQYDYASLKVNNTAIIPIINHGGDVRWASGALISFTFDGDSWCMNDGQSSAIISTMNTYNSNSRAPISGQGVADALRSYARLNSPAFTGVPTAPTMSVEAAPSSQIATTAYVNNILQEYNFVLDTMRFIGVVNSNSDLPLTDYKQGWTYRVGVNGTYAGNRCEAGDIIIATSEGPLENDTLINEHWTVIQSNLDGAVIGPAAAVNGNVAVFDGASGKLIKDSGMKLTAQGIIVARYRASSPKIPAYTGHYITNSTTNNQATTLASVSQGWLTLAPGIVFETTPVIDDIVAIVDEEEE